MVGAGDYFITNLMWSTFHAPLFCIERNATIEWLLNEGVHFTGEINAWWSWKLCWVAEELLFNMNGVVKNKKMKNSDDALFSAPTASFRKFNFNGPISCLLSHSLLPDISSTANGKLLDDVHCFFNWIYRASWKVQHRFTVSKGSDDSPGSIFPTLLKEGRCPVLLGSRVDVVLWGRAKWADQKIW